MTVMTGNRGKVPEVKAYGGRTVGEIKDIRT